MTNRCTSYVIHVNIVRYLRKCTNIQKYCNIIVIQCMVRSMKLEPLFGWMKSLSPYQQHPKFEKKNKQTAPYILLLFYHTVRDIQTNLCTPQLISSPVQSKMSHSRQDQEIHKKFLYNVLTPKIEPWLN